MSDHFISKSQLDSYRFQLNSSFMEEYRGTQPDWGPIGYVTYKRTYARPVPNEERSEEWWETIKRVVEGTYTIQRHHCKTFGLPWNGNKAQKSAQEMFRLIWDFKFLPPGRGLWMMGTDFLWKKGGACLNNCSFVSTKDLSTDFADPFCFLMDMSMLGVGVGGDTKGVGKIKIRTPKLTDEEYVIEDTREGWVELVRTILNSYVGKCALPTNINYDGIRAYGEPIKGFGGTSSGPLPLIRLVQDLQDILNPICGEQINSTAIVDLFNCIGRCVVSGNVRRSAEIMFGEPDDEEFLQLKNPEINQKMLEKWRWTSNNSVIVKDGDDYSKLAKFTAKNGEPGYFWLDTARKYSRLCDPPDNKDALVEGANPCFSGETLIALADGRGALPIKQLVEEGNDVPVYSIDKEGQVQIKMGRNPRLTRKSSKLIEITLDDDSKLRVTPDHKMILLNGLTCEAKDIRYGDNLPRFSKRQEAVSKDGNKYWQITTNTRDPQKKGSRVFEHRLISQFNEPLAWKNTYDEEQNSGWLRGDLVVHHKDYNPLNNKSENLQIMTFKDHMTLHGSIDNTGEKNPMWGRQQSEETRKKIGEKTRERCADPEFIARLSASHTEAERQATSERMSVEQRGRLLKYYKEQEASTDLETVWMESNLHAVKSCESCNKEFIVPWRIRGQSYCSKSCGNTKAESIAARKVGQKVAFTDKQRQTLHDQIRVYKDLQENLKREPMKKEWEGSCRNQGVSFRIRKAGTTDNPHAITSYKNLKERVQDYNHRVKSVKLLDIEEPVYNISVEDNHTLAIVTSNNGNKYSGIYTSNCSEQSLESMELCCLVETFPGRHETYKEYRRTLKFAYLYAKTVTLVKTHNKRTNAVMLRNRRIGTSQSGVAQSFQRHGIHEHFKWCDEGYKYIRDLDRIYSGWLCVPHSIKVTSIKPSGTVSLLPGATHGIHFPYAEYYWRTIRFDKGSSLTKALRDAGYRIEQGETETTSIIYFPVKEKNFSRSVQDLSIWEQLEIAAQMQYFWADNQVSVTINFKPEESKYIETALQLYDHRMKSVSFLPFIDHGYKHAPIQPISQQEYEEAIANLKPLNLSKEGNTSTEEGGKYCDSASCVL